MEWRCPTHTYVSQKDLLEHVDLSAAECLNENPQKPLAYAMKQGYAASNPSIQPRRVLAARRASSSLAGFPNPKPQAGGFLALSYREDDGLALESDADEQLLIHIPFTQVVKLHTLCLKAVDGDRWDPLMR
jgi:hypothetical protein